MLTAIGVTCGKTGLTFEAVLPTTTPPLKIDPLYARAYGNRGLARLSQGDWGEAQKDFARCLAIDPKLKLALEVQIERVNKVAGKKL